MNTSPVASNAVQSVQDMMKQLASAQAQKAASQPLTVKLYEPLSLNIPGPSVNDQGHKIGRIINESA